MQNLKVIENEEVKWYIERIVDMLNHIENEKFLRRIYIILNDYICKNN